MTNELYCIGIVTNVRADLWSTHDSHSKKPTLRLTNARQFCGGEYEYYEG